MNWDEELYVKVYTRDTVIWKKLPWQGKCLLPLLFRKVDRRGELSIGDDPIGDLSAICEVPLDLVRVAYDSLVTYGTIEVCGKTLRLPNFEEAQRSRTSNRLRQQAFRERQKTAEIDVFVTQRNAALHSVTDRNAALHVSQNVTNRRDEMRRDEIKNSPSSNSYSASQAQPKPSSSTELVNNRKVRKKPSTAAPTSEATSQQVTDWFQRWNIPEADSEADRFLNHARASGRLCADWQAAWRNWKKSPFAQRVRDSRQTLQPVDINAPWMKEG